MKKGEIIFVCFVFFVFVGAFMVNVQCQAQEPEQQENSSQANDAQNEVQQENELTESQERLEVDRSYTYDIISVWYYYRDQHLATHHVLLESHWAYPGSRLILYDASDGAPTIFIWSRDGRVTSVGTVYNTYLCEGTEHEVSCA